MRYSLFACSLLIASGAVLADPGGTEADSEYAIAPSTQTDFGIDLRAQRQHQTFEHSSADIDTLSLQPWLQVDNWSFTADLPWQRARGDYFVVGGAQPSARQLCQASGAFLQRHPALSQLAGAVCPGSASTASGSRDESGIGDITAFAHYGKPLDAAGIWLGSVGLGYKADSGDIDKSLGSGTRDAMAEAVLGAGVGRFNATAVAGYAWIVGGEAEQGTNDYAYGSVDLAVKARQWLTLGVNWDYQQAYVPRGDDVQSVSGYVTLRPLEHLSLRLYARDYLDTLGYPDREYGGYVSLSF